jgi:hypothetical protein
MTWWGYILMGVVWVAAVVGMLVISLDAAGNAVDAELASDFGGAQIGTAVVSAFIFGGPGLYFIMIGIRKMRGTP